MKKFSLFLAAVLTVTMLGGCNGSQSSDLNEKVIRVCVSNYLYAEVETIAQIYREKTRE